MYLCVVCGMCIICEFERMFFEVLPVGLSGKIAFGHAVHNKFGDEI